MRNLMRILFRFGSDRSGAIAVVTALSFTCILGFAALGVEATQWYTQSRSMQAAADDAALSAAVAYAEGDTSSYQTEATSVAGADGYVAGAGNITVTVSKPPQNGNYSGVKSAIAVSIVAPVKPILAAPFLSAFNITREGVALIGGQASEGCVLALDPTASGAATISGTSTNVALSKCAFDVNSSSSSGLTLTGGATLTASAVNLVGNYSLGGSSSISASGGILIDQRAVSDPYAGRTIQSFSGCDYHISSPITGNVTLQPGVYCGNTLKITNGAVVTFAPGVYILDQISFVVEGNATVQGTGVTIILTSSGQVSSIGNIVINGGSTVDLTAPTSGPYSGMVFWQDGRAPDSNTDNFSGGSSMKITGAIYTPSQSVSYSGGNGTAGGGCTQLIAYNINLSGGSEFDNNCAGTGVTSIVSMPSLAELVQ